MEFLHLLISQMSFGGEASGFMKSGLFSQANGSLSAKVTTTTELYLLAPIVQKVDNAIQWIISTIFVLASLILIH